MTLVGNPVMHHLLLGIDPTELGGAPFALAFDAALRLPAARARPARQPRRARVRAAVHRRARRRRHRRRDPRRGAAPRGRGQPRSSTSARTPRSCSGTASGCSPRRARPGPAFEGAQISCGQRAAPGAIERVRIDPETLEPRVRVDRLRRLVGRAGVSRRRASRASAARGSSRSIAELHLAGVIDDRRHDRRRARGADAARRAGRADVLVRPLGRRAGAARSPRTTSGRSSSPRRRSTPAAAS